MDEIKSMPLYKEAFKAFSAGDHARGKELMNQLIKDTECLKKVNTYTEQNKEKFDELNKKFNIINIKKNEPIPQGYNRNTYSDVTCITQQQQDLPEWVDIVTAVEYKGELVYEDHYTFEFTADNILYGIKKSNPEPYIGRIKSQSSLEHTLDKMNKNMLFKIISSLHVTLEDVNYNVINILNIFSNSKVYNYLEEVYVNHFDRVYSVDEVKNIKKLFKKSLWKKITFVGKFSLEKC
jgi:hypothetical protein